MDFMGSTNLQTHVFCPSANLSVFKQTGAIQPSSVPMFAEERVVSLKKEDGKKLETKGREGM